LLSRIAGSNVPKTLLAVAGKYQYCYDLIRFIYYYTDACQLERSEAIPGRRDIPAFMV